MPKLTLQKPLTYPVFVDLNPALQYQKRVELAAALAVVPEVENAIAPTKQLATVAAAVVGLLVKGKVEGNFNDTLGDHEASKANV